MVFLTFSKIALALEPLRWYLPPDRISLPQSLHRDLYLGYFPYFFLLHLLLDALLLRCVLVNSTPRKWGISLVGFSIGTFLFILLPVFELPAMNLGNFGVPLFYVASLAGLFVCLIFVRASFLLYNFDDLQKKRLFWVLIPMQFVIVVLLVWAAYTTPAMDRFTRYSGAPYRHLEAATKHLHVYFEKYKTLPYVGRKEVCTISNHLKVGRTLRRKVCLYTNKGPITPQQESLHVLGWKVSKESFIRLCYAAKQEGAKRTFQITAYVNNFCRREGLFVLERSGAINAQSKWSIGGFEQRGYISK